MYNKGGNMPIYTVLGPATVVNFGQRTSKNPTNQRAKLPQSY